jgi:hypothetical protein
MLVDRLTDTEIALKSLMDSSKFDIVAIGPESHNVVSAALFGAPDMTITKSLYYKHPEDDLHIMCENGHLIAISCPDYMTVSGETNVQYDEEWHRGKPTWMDKHVERFLGADIYESVYSKWCDIAEKDKEATVTRDDVGLGEKFKYEEQHVPRMWIEIGLKAEIPELKAWDSEYGYLILDMRDFIEILEPYQNVNIAIVQRIVDISRKTYSLLCRKPTRKRGRSNLNNIRMSFVSETIYKFHIIDVRFESEDDRMMKELYESMSTTERYNLLMDVRDNKKRRKELTVDVYKSDKLWKLL